MDDKIKRLLQQDLEPRFIKTREGAGGKVLSYVDNHYVTAISNEIFDNEWTSETKRLEHIKTTEYVDKYNKVKQLVGYRATVRITIGDVFREGSGFGNGIDVQEINAHEIALKEAETDARKRALMQFGNPFGLELYDKDSTFKNAAAMRRACQEIEKELAAANCGEDLDNIAIAHKQDFAMLKTSKSEHERQYYDQLVTEAQRLRAEFKEMAEIRGD